MGCVSFTWFSGCFQLEQRWMSVAGHPPLRVGSRTSFVPLSSLVMPTFIIHAYYTFRFFIFHGLGVIIHFSTTPVRCGFVVSVWIFNMWRLKVHGFSTLNVVIHMISEPGKSQRSISADLFCFCLWAVFRAELRTSHSSNSYNYICEFLASEVLQKVAVCVCVWARVHDICTRRWLFPRIVFLTVFEEVKQLHFPIDNQAN